jgi:hypothetical protein
MVEALPPSKRRRLRSRSAASAPSSSIDAGFSGGVIFSLSFFPVIASMIPPMLSPLKAQKSPSPRIEPATDKETGRSSAAALSLLAALPLLSRCTLSSGNDHIGLEDSRTRRDLPARRQLGSRSPREVAWQSTHQLAPISQ